jgi:hypothetical protein
MDEEFFMTGSMTGCGIFWSLSLHSKSDGVSSFSIIALVLVDGEARLGVFVQTVA